MLEKPECCLDSPRCDPQLMQLLRIAAEPRTGFVVSPGSQVPAKLRERHTLCGGCRIGARGRIRLRVTRGRYL